MDPTQEITETRKFMASIKEALDRIIGEFRDKRQDALPSDKSPRDRA